MRLVDFLTEYREAIEDEKERRSKHPTPNHYKPTKHYRPKRHR